MLGLHLRCLGCGEAVSLQALDAAVLLGIPLPPKTQPSATGYIEGEEWVGQPNLCLDKAAT